MTLPEIEPERPRCPVKENQVRLLEAAHEQAMSVMAPSHPMDVYCDFDCGPRAMDIPRGWFMAKILGATRSIEVCCWRPSETPVELP